MRLLDLDLHVLWILIISGTATILGFATIAVLEWTMHGQHPRIHPPFYLQRAALLLLQLGIFMFGVAAIVLGVLVLRN